MGKRRGVEGYPRKEGKREQGWGYNSMVECLLCTQEDIGSSPFISRFLLWNFLRIASAIVLPLFSNLLKKEKNSKKTKSGKSEET